MPLESRERLRQRAEDGIVAAGLCQLDVVPADLRLWQRADPRARRAREELHAEADSEHRRPAREQLLQPIRLGAKPGMRVVVIRVHRAAEDEYRVIRLERPGRRSAPREAPFVEPVAALLDRRREELGACIVAVDDREHVHRAQLYAAPPVAGTPLRSSSTRNCRAFVAACDSRLSGFSGSADVELLLKNA